MQLSKESLATLKNFATINGGIVLKPGQFVMTRSVNGATYAEATLSDEIDAEFGIYDLNAFLSILSLADENASISLNKEGDISIKGARSEITWPSADPSTIVAPKKQISFPTANVIFELNAEEYQQIMRVSRGLGADTLTIGSEDGKIVIKSFNKIADSKLEKPLYKFDATEYNDSNNFNFVINIANMKMQQDSYKVLLWATGEMFASKFEGTTASYVLAVEADSTHDF
jgi:hypothetical protein